MKPLPTLLTATWLVLAAFPARAQENRVDYFDPATKKDANVRGQIQAEGPGGITISERGQTRLIPALSITQVTYVLGSVPATEFRRPFGKESVALGKSRKEDQKAGLTEALHEFEQLAVKARDSKNAFRYVQYKIAQVKYRLAQLEAGSPTAHKAAVTALTDFAAKFPDGWQIVPALKMLADLHEEQGDVEGARGAYEKLLATPDVPRDLKDRSELMVAQLLVRGKRFTEAESKLQALLKGMSQSDPQRGYIQLSLVEAQIAQNKLGQVEADLKNAINTYSEPGVRAAAHNLLGDYFRLKNQNEEAFWHYLHVDALYAQDRDQHARAMYNLMKLFESLRGDRVRAQRYYEKLTDKALAGTEYYRKAAAEKPPLSSEK
jgi:hypothetical protein